MIRNIVAEACLAATPAAWKMLVTGVMARAWSPSGGSVVIDGQQFQACWIKICVFCVPVIEQINLMDVLILTPNIDFQQNLLHCGRDQRIRAGKLKRRFDSVAVVLQAGGNPAPNSQ